MSTAQEFMRRALVCAKKAAALGEVPVGAVIVKDGVVIASGYNKRESGKNALLHAEMIAIHRACRKLGGWRLNDCDLYVTLEPCPMCTGAIMNARIRRVYIGAMDPGGGCMGSVCNLTAYSFQYRPEIVYDVLKEECTVVLSEFFRSLRVEKKPSRATVSLRPFEAEDVPVLKQYLYPNLSKADLASLVTQWNTYEWDGRYGASFAVIAEDSPVGLAQLCEKNDGNAGIDVQIFSGFRGKGYGTQAVSILLKLAAEKGYRSFVARVRKTNTPSLRLCKRIGFQIVEEEKTQKGVEIYHLAYKTGDA